MDQQSISLGILAVLLLGIFAQWVAWRVRIPSILILLLLGFVAGPGTGLLDPDALFGQLLFPIVSISVAIILFEGGLNLRFSELGGIRSVVTRLVTLGMFVTWLIAAWGAYEILEMEFALSILLGAILTVSGPTVVMPLLRHIRPKVPLGEILKWEGILIDPVGALMAVLAFEAILAGELSSAPQSIAMGVLMTVVVGGLCGALGALVMVVVSQRHLIPDYLENPFVLTSVVAVFTASNTFHHESGLFAVTLMAIILANTKSITIHHILEFKESLTFLIISALFILLAARISIDDLMQLDLWNSVLFMLLLLFVARPASVAVSTVGSGLSFRERLFLSWVMPRGIVAAAIASIFAFELAANQHPGWEKLVPATFLVIIGTVIVYSLTAGLAAKFLNVATKSPQGFLVLGSNHLSQPLALAIQEEGVPVLMVDTNFHNVMEARNTGLNCVHGNVLTEGMIEELDLDGIGRLLAMTPNDEANALAALRLSSLFERANVYQLPSEKILKEKVGAAHLPKHLRGRDCFGTEHNYYQLVEKIYRGWSVKKTKLTEEFDYADFVARYGESAIPLCLISQDRKLSIVTADAKPAPKKGQSIIALVENGNGEPKR